MRYSNIEKIPVKRPHEELQQKQNYTIAAQIEDGYLVLDIWKASKYKYRYVMDTDTYEYALKRTDSGIWHNQKICNIEDEKSYWIRYSWSDGVNISKEDLKCITDSLQKITYSSGLSVINAAEERYAERKRERAYDSKVDRIDKLMAQVPPVPRDFKTWILSMLADKEYAFWNKEKENYSCSSCGNTAKMIKLDTSRDAKIRNGDLVKCSKCHKKLQVKKRCDAIEKSSQAMLLSPVNDRMSVARHFKICVCRQYGKRREVFWEEGVRIFLLRNDPKWNCRIYYNQYTGGYEIKNIRPIEIWWDTNPANRRIGLEFLYPKNIAECLKDTSYEEHTRFFEAAAESGYQANYNDIMRNFPECGEKLEYLYKGRFYRLLKEFIDKSWLYRSQIRSGSDIREITGINDMQMVHRLRDKNGGTVMMEWLSHADETQKKISNKALDFFDLNKIKPGKCRLQAGNMSPDQIMNYLIRQQKEQYPGLIYMGVLEQWNDYLSMCLNLNKDINDQMIYRPKELKRRHDEAVEDMNRKEIIEDMKRNPEERQKQAQNMREKYPGAEEVLKEIKEKYEYRTEEFLILVPRSLLDIITEGQALHHCVAFTDRYFDRIKTRETYILFLRKAEDPEVPYYTLEVEPNGTIRQHRSYFDEEPNIEYIRGFLKEWQQVIKKRMSRKDHEYAESSRQLREKNIRELKENNNTRVLKGLEQDFLEAV